MLLRAVHAPAVSTALGFAFYAQQRQAVGVFLIAPALLAALVALQRLMARLVRRPRVTLRSLPRGPGRPS